MTQQELHALAMALYGMHMHGAPQANATIPLTLAQLLHHFSSSN